MTKLRKQKRRKTFRYNVNRKRMRNKINNRGKILCKEIKEAWILGKSIEANLVNMGLSSDPNKTIKIGQPGDQVANHTGWKEEVCKESLLPTKAYVAEQLENEAKAPRRRMFRVPKAQVNWITYLMNTYGDDYKAMARDKKNHYQETWKQLRAKIKQFKNIPEQYSKYLKERGIVDGSSLEENMIDNDDE